MSETPEDEMKTYFKLSNAIIEALAKDGGVLIRAVDASAEEIQRAKQHGRYFMTAEFGALVLRGPAWLESVKALYKAHFEASKVTPAPGQGGTHGP